MKWFKKGKDLEGFPWYQQMISVEFHALSEKLIIGVLKKSQKLHLKRVPLCVEIVFIMISEKRSLAEANALYRASIDT